MSVAVTEPVPVARPFIKFPGGKTQLLPELLRRVPATYGTYHEPFLGGGALYFALRPQRAVLGDVNRRLIQTWSAVARHFEGPLGVLRRLRNYEIAYREAQDKAAYFYEVRAADLDDVSEAALAAWLIFLNKTCFNGLYRVNRSGKFNVPFGRYKNPTICDEENLRACSAVLAGAKLVLGDFEEAMSRAQPGDLCYCDPPYVPLSTSSSFTAYTAGGFGPKDQERLRDVALDCKRRGVHVLLSNSSADSVEKLYARDFQVEKIPARRSINSKASGRGAINEFIIR